MVAHVPHALQQGASSVLVCTVDTDVIVILAGIFHDLVVIQPLTDVWVTPTKSSGCQDGAERELSSNLWTMMTTIERTICANSVSLWWKEQRATSPTYGATQTS